MEVLSESTENREEPKVGYVGRIPIRNIWLLLFYASDLFREMGKGNIAIEDQPDDIPDLVAELLAYVVERRLRRNLNQCYRTKNAVMNRVRGRINLFDTERHAYLSRGKISCRFEEYTVNTPRNRYVREALFTISKLTNQTALKRKCHSLAETFKMLGVAAGKPSKKEIFSDRIGRHDIEDKIMISAAMLVFDLALPTEESGNNRLFEPDREKKWLERIFEKAIGGFYKVVLTGDGWNVTTGNIQNFQQTEKTQGIDQLLPSMKTDIKLENKEIQRRIIIDTKFNSIINPGHYRENTFSSGYIYQIYTYLRSQEYIDDPMSINSSGILLHPSIDTVVNESVVIQGHPIKFATVDLTQDSKEIRRQLLKNIQILF